MSFCQKVKNRTRSKHFRLACGPFSDGVGLLDQLHILACQGWVVVMLSHKFPTTIEPVVVLSLDATFWMMDSRTEGDDKIIEIRLS